MFICTKLDVENNKVEILKTLNDKKDAVAYLYEHLDQKDNEELVILDKKDTQDFVKQYKRVKGWIFNEKILKYVYQIVEHPLKKDHIITKSK